MAIENAVITGYNSAQVTDSQWWTTDSGARSSPISGLTMGEDVFQNLPLNTEVAEYDYAIIPCGDAGEIRIKVQEFESNGYYYTCAKIHKYSNGSNNEAIIDDNYYIQYGNQVVPEWSIAFGIDRENEAGYVTLYQFDYGDTYYTNAIPLVCTRKQLYDLLIGADMPPIVASNGGGATHIAKRTGLLKDLSSYTSDILIVAGGGGGAYIKGEDGYGGAHAGGIQGSNYKSGTQSTGYAFGQGEST